MRGFPAKLRLRTGLFLAFGLLGSTALTACTDLDNALFGDESSMAASDAAFPAADAGAPPTAGASNVSVPMPPPAFTATPSGVAPVATITPVTVLGGSDTGTPARWRGE